MDAVTRGTVQRLSAQPREARDEACELLEPARRGLKEEYNVQTGPAARTPAESPHSPDALRRARRRSPGEQDSTCGASISFELALSGREVFVSKSSEKPKKQQKQKPQKTLKERRSEKRAAKKLGSGSFLTADK
jgi:hypothetical protein